MRFLVVPPGEQLRGFDSEDQLAQFLSERGLVEVFRSWSIMPHLQWCDVIVSLARDVQPAMFEPDDLNPPSVGALF